MSLAIIGVLNLSACLMLHPRGLEKRLKLFIYTRSQCNLELYSFEYLVYSVKALAGSIPFVFFGGLVALPDLILVPAAGADAIEVL